MNQEAALFLILHNDRNLDFFAAEYTTGYSARASNLGVSYAFKSLPQIDPPPDVPRFGSIFIKAY